MFNNQIIFLLLTWSLLILVIFLMKKSLTKTYFFTLLCLVIISHPIHIQFFNGINLSLSIILCFLGTFLFFAPFALHYKTFISSILIILLYTSLFIWAKLAPIWFVIDPVIFIPLCMALIARLLLQDLIVQIAVGSFSITFGHVLYYILLFHYRLQYDFTKETLFISLFFTLVLLIIMEFIRKVRYSAYKITY